MCRNGLLETGYSVHDGPQRTALSVGYGLCAQEQEDVPSWARYVHERDKSEAQTEKYT